MSLFLAAVLFGSARLTPAALMDERSITETLSILGVSDVSSFGGHYSFRPAASAAQNGFVTNFSTCSFVIVSTQANFPGAGGDGGFTFSTSEPGCQIGWTASTNDSWIQILTPNGTADGVFPSILSIHVLANPLSTPRSGSIVLNAGGSITILTVNQAAGCQYSLSSSGASFSAAAGAGDFTLNTSSGCQWNVQSNDPWIVITSAASGSGTTTVTYTVAANTGPARTGTITAGGQTFTINQANGCTYTLTPTFVSIPVGGGSSNFTVTTGAGCTWTATTNDGFINITSGSGNGNGTVSFTVQPNTGPARNGTITVGNSTFTVNQDSACDYNISSTGATVAVGGGTGSFNVSTGAGCAWTAVSNDSWITITSGSNGTGNGTVSYSVQPNTGPARTGTITAAGHTFTITQGNGCTYVLSPTSATISVNGGTGSFSVTAGAGCTWNAVSNNPWIHITAGSSGNGNGTVSYSVDQNSGGPRSGSITVANVTFTINQVSTCEYSIAFENPVPFFPSAGGQGHVIVTAPAGCEWTATSNVPWITIQSGTGVGNGSFTFVVAPNTQSTRTGEIHLADKSLTITQVSGCSYYLSSNRLDLPARGGSGQFQIETGAGCIWTSSTDAKWLHITSSVNGSGNGTVTFTVDPNTGGARSTLIVVGNASFTITQRAFITARADFDGDGKTDPSFYRPSEGNWYLLRSSLGVAVAPWGTSTDIPTPGDYDHDSVTDIAVFRPQTGEWYIIRSSDNTVFAATWGASTDKPVAYDYDGDGSTDLAVYRPQTGQWFVLRSSDQGFDVSQWGTGDDIPVPGYYDADNRADIAVYRPSNGTWYVLQTTGGGFAAPWGSPGDHPVPADYDGDNRDDIAVFRPSDNNWYILRSGDLGFVAVNWGASGDIPVPGDYDGDGRANVAQFRPSTGSWFVLGGSGYTETVWGGPGDKPIPAYYIP